MLVGAADRGPAATVAVGDCDNGRACASLHKIATPDPTRYLVDAKTAAALHRLRIISVAEAISFLALLIFGSLLSRITDINLVMPLGMLHGVLFIAYLVLLGDVWSKAKWSRGRVALFFLYSVLPTGGFFGDRKIKREQEAVVIAARARKEGVVNA
jgi:integral membrane protein